MSIANATKDVRDWRDLAPLEGWCKVVDMYDGDTCWIVVDLNNLKYNPEDPASISTINRLAATSNIGIPEVYPNICKINVRIARINAPEIKGGTDDTKLAGRTSRDFARSLLLGKIVRFRLGKFGLIKGESLDSFHRQIGELEIPITKVNPNFSGVNSANIGSTNIGNIGNIGKRIIGGAEFVNFSDIMLATGHAVVFTK